MGKKRKRRDDEAERADERTTSGRMKKKPYEKELKALSVELVKLQEWVKHTGHRIVVIFEGRDAAGKGGAIKSISQSMSARDYRGFLAHLEQEFPGESFLIVRFGDHQPALSARIIDPAADSAAIAARFAAYDPRYFTTYYAVDTVNFTPVDLSSALPRLDAAYLPLVIQEAAGLPLDASFAEQKKILVRCRGLFYTCGQGQEARRFNRLLIDAGLIKQL